MILARSRILLSFLSWLSNFKFLTSSPFTLIPLFQLEITPLIDPTRYFSLHQTSSAQISRRSFVLQMPKQTAISVNFKIPPPSLSFTSLFPHSLKITLLSSPILFTPVYFYRYALYQGNLSIYHSLNFIRSLLLYLLNPLSPLTSLPPQHVSLFPWIIS